MFVSSFHSIMFVSLIRIIFCSSDLLSTAEQYSTLFFGDSADVCSGCFQWWLCRQHYCECPCVCTRVSRVYVWTVGYVDLQLAEVQLCPTVFVSVQTLSSSDQSSYLRPSIIINISCLFNFSNSGGDQQDCNLIAGLICIFLIF